MPMMESSSPSLSPKYGSSRAITLLTQLEQVKKQTIIHHESARTMQYITLPKQFLDHVFRDGFEILFCDINTTHLFTSGCIGHNDGRTCNGRIIDIRSQISAAFLNAVRKSAPIRLRSKTNMVVFWLFANSSLIVNDLIARDK